MTTRVDADVEITPREPDLVTLSSVDLARWIAQSYGALFVSSTDVHGTSSTVRARVTLSADAHADAALLARHLDDPALWSAFVERAFRGAGDCRVTTRPVARALV